MRWRRKSREPERSPVAETGTVTLVPKGAPANEPDVADGAVLDELSRVFAPLEDDSGAAPARPTIAIGADEDLPDAMYLDDAIESDTSTSGPVFIDDDGSSDAVLPQEAASRGIEPRLRQRRIGVRRAASRKRLWWIGGVAAVLLVAIGVLAVLGSSLFAIENVSVSGNVYTDADELEAIVEELRGTPTLLVDVDDIETRIEAIAWVDEARVRTNFPDSATIEIRERTPVAAMLGTDGRSRVIDAEGRVLAVIDGQPVALAWISGPGTLDLGAGASAPIGYQAAASLVQKLTPAIRSQLESIWVTPDGADLVLVLTGPSGLFEVRFGSAVGENAQIEKLVRLERILADVADRPVTVIDVSTSEVTVR